MATIRQMVQTVCSEGHIRQPLSVQWTPVQPYNVVVSTRMRGGAAAAAAGDVTQLSYNIVS